MVISVKLSLADLTIGTISDLLSTALSGSWSFGVKWDESLYEKFRINDCLEENLASIILNGHTIEIYDVEDENEHWTFGLQQILSLNEKEDNAKLANLIITWINSPENLDLVAADALLQYMLFGQIIYG